MVNGETARNPENERTNNYDMLVRSRSGFVNPALCVARLAPQLTPPGEPPPREPNPAPQRADPGPTGPTAQCLLAKGAEGPDGKPPGRANGDDDGDRRRKRIVLNGGTTAARGGHPSSARGDL